MATKIHYDPTLDALVIQAIGRISYEDLPLLGQQIIDHPNFKTNINQLFDCTHGQLDLSTDDLKRIAQDFNRYFRKIGIKTTTSIGRLSPRRFWYDATV